MKRGLYLELQLTIYKDLFAETSACARASY